MSWKRPSIWRPKYHSSALFTPAMNQRGTPSAEPQATPPPVVARSSISTSASTRRTGAGSLNSYQSR